MAWEPITPPEATESVIAITPDSYAGHVPSHVAPAATAFGPAAPPRNAWTPAERARLDEVTQALQEIQGQFEFGYLLDSVRAFLDQADCGYLLVEGESGVGKSYFGTVLESMAAQIHPGEVRVAYIKAAPRPYSDYETFIECVNDQLVASNAPRTHRILPLDRVAVDDLAVGFPSPNRRERWTAFLTCLSDHNRGPILLYLDEMDRHHKEESNQVSPVDYLRAQLPKNVHIVVTYRPDASQEFLRQLNAMAGSHSPRLSLNQTADYRRQLDSQLSRVEQPNIREALLQSNEFRLHYARLAAQAWAGQLVDPSGQTRLVDLYTTITQSLGRPGLLYFLLTLCAAFEPISWDDVAEWGTSVDTIQELVELLPATLLQHKSAVFLGVDLAHESLREFLTQQNKEAFAKICRALVGWAVPKIQASNDLKLQSEQGREWARLAFYRLYRWSLLCQDSSLLEAVVRDRVLNKKQVALYQALESSARPHQKLELLDLWVEAHRLLVEEHQRQDLRGEMAWALHSRGSTYQTLHRRQRALVDLDRSVELFDRLVNQERKTSLREGLAAAYDRRGEIHLGLNKEDKALKDSREAVQLFTDLVEDMGREDLLPLLAMAQRNQSAAWAVTGNGAEATRSMLLAITIFAALTEGPEGNLYSKELANCHLQLAQQRHPWNQHEESLQDSARAVVLLNQLGERDSATDVRDLLEKAHLARGSSYLATQQPDKALRDFTKSIVLSTQLLEEGRLDHRDRLADAYSLRSKIQPPREAIRDLTSAMELRLKLVAEGRRDQCMETAQEYLLRAECQRADSQAEACRTDLAAAQTLLIDVGQGGIDVTALLLRTYGQKAALAMQLARYDEVVQEASQALQLGPNREQEAQFLAVRGQAQRRLVQPDKARADLEACIQIYTELVKSDGDPASLVAIAEGYSSLAQVSLLTGQWDQAQKEVKRSVEAFEVSARGGDRRANLARAYSLRAEVQERLGQHQAARQDLSRALAFFTKLVDEEGQDALLDEQALAYRRLGRTLLGAGEANAARDALEHSARRYQALWNRDRRDLWLDELWRTQVVNSAVSVFIKEYGSAEEVMQRAQDHFSGLLQQGKMEYLKDLLETALRRTNNFALVGMHARATEELTGLLEILARTALQYEKVDFRESLARVLHSRAELYASQQSFEQAYNDFEAALQTMQTLVVKECQFHLAKDLSEIYRHRASMLIGAGHVQPGLADLSQAAQMLTVLLGQGRQEVRGPLAQLCMHRADQYLKQNDAPSALEDLNLGIELLMALAASGDDADLFADLAHMLARRGGCLQQAQQTRLALDDFEKAVQLYTRLVDTRGRTDLAVNLGECLLSQLSLSGQGAEDPQRVQALVKGVRLVAQQAREGTPAPESFVMNAVTIVRNSLILRPQQANTDLVECVILLCEAIMQMAGLTYYWAGLSELLTQCYQALEVYKGPKYVAFICLSCASCGREVETTGAASLPRLIYFLTFLGMTFNKERPGEQLPLVGSAFNKLVEQLARQRVDDGLAADLQRLALTWQQLPPGYPAAANVSRGVLTNLLRAN